MQWRFCMARYGANELFNPGGRRKKKKVGVTTGYGSSVGSFGSMAHSQAPDALGMMTKGLAFDKELKDLMKDEGDETKYKMGEGIKALFTKMFK